MGALVPGRGQNHFAARGGNAHGERLGRRPAGGERQDDGEDSGANGSLSGETRTPLMRGFSAERYRPPSISRLVPTPPWRGSRNDVPTPPMTTSAFDLFKLGV